MVTNSDNKELKTFSVLVVDDEECILAFVAIRLKVSGYQIFTATNGVDALEIIKKKVPDLVIIDLIMPGMDGATLLKRIRMFSSVPVIILSAMDLSEAITAGFIGGADDYLQKPFYPDELIARIEATLRRRQNSDPWAGP
jgi:DNA-binding response OmpR family regulator